LANEIGFLATIWTKCVVWRAAAVGLVGILRLKVNVELFMLLLAIQSSWA